MILIKNANIYAPKPLGIQDILIDNEIIIAIGKELTIETNAVDIEVVDVDGRIVVAGYIDQHVHIIGGGGEDGPYSRTPEVVLSDIINAGVTTVIGVLGTDGTTRHPESLLSKVRGLEKEGVSAYMLTGSYELPMVTITGDAKKDIIIIDKVLGIGEIAVSDHRSSQPTLDELKRLTTQARVGGMLSGKAGVVQYHMGSGEAGLSMLFKIIEETEIPPHHLIPTHINRSEKLLNEGIEFAKKGGYIDMTSGIRSADGIDNENELTPAKAIKKCSESGVPMERVTMSSDGNGSMAVYDERGQVSKLLVAKMDSLHDELRNAIVKLGMKPEEVFAICTENPARANGLYPKKGTVATKSDADLLFLDADYNIKSVMARGRFMMKDNEVLVKGTFE